MKELEDKLEEINESIRGIQIKYSSYIDYKSCDQLPDETLKILKKMDKEVQWLQDQKDSIKNKLKRYQSITPVEKQIIAHIRDNPLIAFRALLKIFNNHYTTPDFSDMLDNLSKLKIILIKESSRGIKLMITPIGREYLTKY